MSRVVILYGPPGGGKGTQANLLAHKKGFVHFDTGQYIEELVHDKKLYGNKIIDRERKLFDTGVLCTPSWILSIVKKKVRFLKKAGLSIVFSGSPRTFYEAFGNNKIEGFMPFVKRLFGSDNVYIFILKIAPKTTLHRNGNRLVCSLCSQSILHSEIKHLTCPFCGAALRKRTLDDPKVIETRLEEYKNRTSPIFAKLKEGGYSTHEINGEPRPEEVFNDIIKYLN